MFCDKYKFYIILLPELFLWPFLWSINKFQHWFCNNNKICKARRAVETSIVAVGVHEWGGYDLERVKKIKNGVSFKCGLLSQIERFAYKDNVELIVTISQIEKHHDSAYIYQHVSKVIRTDNRGMDFSGYAAIYELLKNETNRYIILSNSSVNAVQEDFLEDYIVYMEQNLDVGMLGISYCTKMMQTLIRDNFTPHLQSFFLLTTTDVLRQIVEFNGGKFPGQGIDHKLLLIRRGEIRISKLIQKVGYRLAVVNPIDGKPYKFERYRSWKLPMGDIRQQIDTPNRITPIQQ